MNEFVEGLAAEAYITFDNYSYLRQQLRNDYPTYSIDRYLNAAGDEEIRFTERKKLNLPKKQSIASNSTYRYFGWNARVNIIVRLDCMIWEQMLLFAIRQRKLRAVHKI